MSSEHVDFDECAVCHRNLLRGEKVTEYLTPERETVSVCTLCKSQAERMGWTEARFAQAAPARAEPRRRGFDLRGRFSRRGRGKTADELAREIGIPDRPARPRPEPRPEPAPEATSGFARALPSDPAPDPAAEPLPDPGFEEHLESQPGEQVEHDEEAAESTVAEAPQTTESAIYDAEHEAPLGPEAAADSAADEPEPPDASDPPMAPEPDPKPSESEPASPGEQPERPPDPAEPERRYPRTPARLMRLAAEAFNESEESRKIGGLIRSLGEPHVSVRPPAREDMPALITVAWELSWYQWEVGVEPDDRSVREIAKGGEMSELDEAAQHWNARADEDGMLSLRRSRDRTTA